MARYSALLGRSVEVQYRAGDICLPAAGTLVADSGRSIFLEQHFEQRGQQRNFRWEVPYAYLVRIEERLAAEEVAVLANAASDGQPGHDPGAIRQDGPYASAARASGGSGALLPVPNRPKTA